MDASDGDLHFTSWYYSAMFSRFSYHLTDDGPPDTATLAEAQQDIKCPHGLDLGSSL